MKKKNNRENDNDFKIFLSKAYFKFRQWSFVKHILLFYLFITLIGSLLLYLPISYQDGQDIDYVDALFTSASSFSDTGLATLTTASTWTYFGQAIIAILILIGGIGWFALKIYLFNILLGRPISFRTRETLAGERGSSKLGNTRQLVKVSVTILLILVAVASMILTLFFYFNEPNESLAAGFSNTTDPIAAAEYKKDFVIENPYGDALTSLRFGIFHAISGLNNAGFDIIGNSSLMPYYDNYTLQFIFIILFVTGGIGYPVLYDIYMYFKSKVLGEKFKFSLFTKISTVAYAVIALSGIILAFILEVPKKNGFWNDPTMGSTGDKTMAIIFNTMSTRNAGFATIPMGNFSPGTHLLFSIMMFIGSAPSSTAGGIRTTTAAISMLGLWSKIRGKKSVRAFNRRITPETVSRSYIVVTTSIIIVTVGTLILMSSLDSYGGQIPEKDATLNVLLFETASAFGTTGLSTGITSSLSTISKLVLILIMFIGQLGVSSSLLVWNSKRSKSRKYEYIEEDVTIG